MKRQHLWLIILILIVINFMSVAYFLGKGEPSQSEVVAQIGKDEITRQDWLNEMEGRYGKEVLDEMIDGKVIEAAGDKYDVEIDKEEIDREIKMLKSAYGTSAAALSINEDQWRKQIKDSLMLEELLTKEVSISEEKLQQYFEDNQAQYEIKDTYHLSQIVLATKEEAEQTVKELDNGSSFTAMALEKSTDTLTAAQGGDLGYVTVDDENYETIIKAAQDLKAGEWSDPVKTDEGYAIVLLQEFVEGETYSFKDVKSQIRRQMALEQMDLPVSTEPFKDEVNIETFYDGAL